MSDERILLSKDQALSMLDEGDYIHTFRSTAFALIGCDWSRASVVEAIESSKCELGGPSCQAMNHGLVVHCDGKPLFVECKKDFDYAAFEKQLVSVD